MGDTHIYLNHIEPLREQIERKPDPFPLLKFNYKEDVPFDKYKMEDFELAGYHPQKTIKMEMAI